LIKKPKAADGYSDIKHYCAISDSNWLLLSMATELELGISFPMSFEGGGRRVLEQMFY